MKWLIHEEFFITVKKRIDMGPHSCAIYESSKYRFGPMKRISHRNYSPIIIIRETGVLVPLLLGLVVVVSKLPGLIM
jgi:hypothetical protein